MMPEDAEVKHWNDGLWDKMIYGTGLGGYVYISLFSLKKGIHHFWFTIAFQFPWILDHWGKRGKVSILEWNFVGPMGFLCLKVEVLGKFTRMGKGTGEDLLGWAHS